MFVLTNTMEEVDGNYESDNSSYEYSLGEDNHKKRKYGDDERLKRCRERNRIHARNTRERKRIQMEGLQQRIQDLMDEVFATNFNLIKS